MLSIFSCASWPSVCLLWWNVYLGLLHIFKLGFFLILSYMSCLYILEINPLSVASFPNIFSHSEGCLFVLFIVSFAMQKLLSLIRSHLFIFVFIFLTLGGGSEWPSSKNLQTINAGEGMEKRKHFCTVGGNVTLYSHYGEQYVFP